MNQSLKILLLYKIRPFFVFIEGFDLRYGHVSCLVMRRKNLSLHSLYSIKLYQNRKFDLLVKLILFHQPEENPTIGKILEKYIH